MLCVDIQNMSDSASASLYLNPRILASSSAQYLTNATHRDFFKMLEISTAKNQAEVKNEYQSTSHINLMLVVKLIMSLISLFHHH